jgi:hypothetical protein
VLRQLARLTRPVRAADGALAIAVYADGRDRPISARDRGHEGVACVDDAARALVVLCDLWTATRLPLAEQWARGLLEFVLYMQDPDGRFVNFITDWSGSRNESGPTSLFSGGSFWQARAVQGLASASIAFDDARAARGVLLGMAHVRAASAPADVRAIHVLAALDLLRAGRAPDLRADLEAWCAELLGCQSGGILYDDHGQEAPHLWAHIQEGALAEAGAYLERADLVAAARRSADRYLVPLIGSGFDLRTVQPYGVACAIFGVDRLAAVTGEPRYARLVEVGRSWFRERNPAGRAVYDRAAGRVHDGIDRGVLNAHSGAESNIAAAGALFPELAMIAERHHDALERVLLEPVAA